MSELTMYINEKCLIDLVYNQLNTFFPDGNAVLRDDIHSLMEKTLKRVFVCFSNIRRKYFYEDGNVLFNHLHSDQYAMFLYLLSNTAWQQEKNEHLAKKIFLLNKTLHGIDAYFSIELPECFLFIHPIGTILGNATYGNFFCVYQNCSIGALSTTGGYPKLGTGVVMYSRTSILGPCVVGNDVVFGANSMIINKNIPDNSVVLGQHPNNRIQENHIKTTHRIFDL